MGIASSPSKLILTFFYVSKTLFLGEQQLPRLMTKIPNPLKMKCGYMIDIWPMDSK